jgi:hypothetical protein
MNRGAPIDEALAVLDRLDRLEHSAVPSTRSTIERGERPRGLTGPESSRARSALRIVGWTAIVSIAAAAVGVAVIALHPDWRSLLVRDPAPRLTPTPTASNPSLPLPRRGETLLKRAQLLEASGRLREALVTLELVRSTDPQKADADRLRASIQKTLIGLAAPAPRRPTAGTGTQREP